MTKIILKFSILIFTVFVALIYLNFFSNIVFPWQKKDAIETSLNWGGLSNLPSSIGNIDVEQKGSMFTRQFIVKFYSDQKDIQNWITNSKRLKSKVPKINNKTKVYEIYPGENGALGGKVEIEGTKVLINMSWN